MSYSSSSSSSSSASDMFTDINNLPIGIHVIYNPQAVSTFNHTHKSIPKKINNIPIKVHDPRKTYNNYSGIELWKMAIACMTDTVHTIVDDNGEEIEVDTCYPAIDAEDFFDFDKVDSTSNIIFLYIKKVDDETIMKGFILCRDLHLKTLKKMRTKARIEDYGDNGDV